MPIKSALQIQLVGFPRLKLDPVANSSWMNYRKLDRFK